MKDELISPEVMQLTKEVGFENYTNKPATQSLLQRFIREVLGIHIVISPSWCEGESEASYFYELYSGDIQEEVFLNEEDKYNHGSTLYFSSYEDALEDALEDGLKNSILYAKKLNLK